MSKVLTSARHKGIASVEQSLESWQADRDERAERGRAVAFIDSVRENSFDKYGQMRESVELIREDRERK